MAEMEVQAWNELALELMLSVNLDFREEGGSWWGWGGNADLAQGALCRAEEGVIAGAGGSVLGIKHVELQGLLFFKKVLKGQHPGEDGAGAGAQHLCALHLRQEGCGPSGNPGTSPGPPTLPAFLGLAPPQRLALPSLG